MNNEKIISLLKNYKARKEDDFDLHKSARNESQVERAKHMIDVIDQAVKFLESK